MKKFMLIVATVLALLAAAQTDAKADSILTETEKGYVADSWVATCGVIGDEFIGTASYDMLVLNGIADAISEHYGITLDNSVDVINEQVYEYCPQYWDDLQAIGAYARGEYRGGPGEGGEDNTPPVRPTLKRAI